MTAKLKEVTTAENASKMPQHIYDTFIVGAGISGLAAAKRLDDVGYENYKIIEKATRVGGHGEKILILAVVVMCHLPCIRILLRPVVNGAIYLHASLKF